MRRVAQSITEAGGSVLNCGSPGWTLTQDNIKKLLSASPVLEWGAGTPSYWTYGPIAPIWVPSTDEMGFPVKPEKSPLDGRFHIVGALQAAPTAVFKKILKDAEPLLKSVNFAKVVLVIPFHRYVTGKCCNESTHISNRVPASFWAELDRCDHGEKWALR